jgi:hypothetical protein
LYDQAERAVSVSGSKQAKYGGNDSLTGPSNRYCLVQAALQNLCRRHCPGDLN